MGVNFRWALVWATAEQEWPLAYSAAPCSVASGEEV